MRNLVVKGNRFYLMVLHYGTGGRPGCFM